MICWRSIFTLLFNYTFCPSAHVDTVGWFPSYEKCWLISTLWKVLVDFHLMISSVRFPSVGWFPSCGKVDCHLKRSSGWFLSYDKWRLIFILWEVWVDFYSMASVGCFPCYGKCWLIFILWEVRVDEVLYKGGRQVWVGGETSGKVSPHQSVG